MASIFSRIVAGEIPCYKVAETEDFLAFLDINPLAKGHTLCIPKKEIDYIFDIDDQQFAALHLFSKRVAKALKQTVPCLRVGVAVQGLDVPHAHIHLIPLNSPDDLDFKKANRPQFTPEEMKDLAASIASRF